MAKGTVTVAATVGLHARPAADFVRTASLSNHKVTITNKMGKKVSGTSILGVLSLGAKQGEVLVIEVDGPNEDEVLESLIRVVAKA